MKRKKAGKNRKKKKEKIRIMLCVGFFMFFTGIGLSRRIDWTLPPWGLNLEELNQAVKDKATTGQIKEDKIRPEIEIHYSPGKSLKIRKGKVVALISFSDPSTPGRLYGYAFEGKFFGRVILFKDHPEFFPETVIRTLKEQYPQGKAIRSFSTTQRNPYFEYKSDQLFIFSTERGVFFYEPSVLGKVVKTGQERIDLEKQRFDQGARDEANK